MFATLGALCVAPAQSRLYVNGSPTNMLVDWSQIATLPDPAQSDAFLAIMPLSAVETWAVWQPDIFMDAQFGVGNWTRVRMEATDWAYLSPDACAHQPAAGAAAPQSLLTSNYDFGAYTGVAGSPLFPGATQFGGSPVSYVEGLGQWAFYTNETWQLRTRGFWTNELWNACPGSANVTPNFTGYLGVRIRFSLL